MNTIVFENKVQVALWKNELTGQISDGMWENARPNDHWQVWCNATAVVRQHAEDATGRNFWAKKDNYMLNNSELLEAVGDRMLTIANVAAMLDYCGEIPDGVWTYNFYVSRKGTGRSYVDEMVDEWDAVGLTAEVMLEAENNRPAVSEKEMLKELRSMRKIIKTKLY